MKPIYTIGLIALVGALAYLLFRKEGYSHRVPTVRNLEATEAYSINPRDSAYYQPYNFVLDGQVEGYSDVYKCNKVCRNVLGATPHEDCMRACENSMIGSEGLDAKECMTAKDCHWNDICVKKWGAVGGYCMDPNEPGVPWAHPESSLSPGVPVLSPGVPVLHPGVPVLHPGVPTLTPGVPTLRPGMPVLAPGVPVLHPSMPLITPGIAEVYPRAHQLNPGINPTQGYGNPAGSVPYVDPSIAEIMRKPLSCPPSQFYNAKSGSCEPRFQ